MSTSNKLKAFVRFDGSGRVVPSSLILARFKPKVGNYREINSSECCDGSCAVPVYGENFILEDVVESETGTTFYFATSPGFTMQVQLVQDVNLDMCQTGRGAGAITTVPPDSSEFAIFYTTEEMDNICAIQVRQQCNPDFYSQWLSSFGG